MTIILAYAGQLAIETGAQSESVDVADSATVAEVVRAAAARHPATFAELLFGDNGRLRESVLIMHNGVQSHRGTVSLTDGDELFLLTPMAGG